MSLLGMKGGTGIGTDPRFLVSIWTQIWTWLDSNPVIGVGVQNWPKVDDVIYEWVLSEMP